MVSHTLLSIYDIAKLETEETPSVDEPLPEVLEELEIGNFLICSMVIYNRVYIFSDIENIVWYSHTHNTNIFSSAPVKEAFVEPHPDIDTIAQTANITEDKIQGTQHWHSCSNLIPMYKLSKHQYICFPNHHQHVLSLHW